MTTCPEENPVRPSTNMQGVMPLSDAYRGIEEELSETAVENEEEQEHMADSTGVRRGFRRAREESEEIPERQVRPRDDHSVGQASAHRVGPDGREPYQGWAYPSAEYPDPNGESGETRDPHWLPVPSKTDGD